MGLVQPPERRMGELSYRCWRRAAVGRPRHPRLRLGQARAIAFMRDNTALTDANIEAEVNRYIAGRAGAGLP